MRALRGGVGVVGLGTALLAVVNFILGILSARWLGPADRGVFTLVLVVSSVSSLLAVAGLTEFLLRGRDAAARDARTSYVWGVVVGLPITTGALVYVAAVGYATITVMLCLTVLILVGTTSVVSVHVVLASSNMVTGQGLRLLGPVAVCSGLVLLYLGGQVGLEAALMVLTMGSVLAAVCGVVVVCGLAKPKAGAFRRLRGEVPHLAASQVPRILLSRVDVLLVGGLFSSANLAQYSVAAGVSAAAMGLIASMGVLIIKRGGGADGEHLSAVATTTAWMTMLAVLLLGDRLIEVAFGPQYDEAAALVRWVGVAYLLLTVGEVRLRRLQALGQRGHAARASLCALAVSAIGVTTGGTQFSLEGAAVGLAVGAFGGLCLSRPNDLSWPSYWWSVSGGLGMTICWRNGRARKTLRRSGSIPV